MLQNNTKGTGFLTLCELVVHRCRNILEKLKRNFKLHVVRICCEALTLYKHSLFNKTHSKMRPKFGKMLL